MLKIKYELIMVKNSDNIETCIDSKTDSKVARNGETESAGKTTHMRNLHQRNHQIFTNFREIFTIVKMIIVNKIDYLLKIPILKIIIMKIIAYGLMVAILKTLIRNHCKV